MSHKTFHTRPDLRSSEPEKHKNLMRASKTFVMGDTAVVFNFSVELFFHRVTLFFVFAETSERSNFLFVYSLVCREVYNILINLSCQNFSPQGPLLTVVASYDLSGVFGQLDFFPKNTRTSFSSGLAYK